jgi:periplasmic divalent cation tolerance protein
MNANKDICHLVAYCTCPPEKADEIARELVRRRVCACVNVVPGLRSVYTWKGAVEEDHESLLVIKTRSDRFGALEAAVREVHPYEVFELIASPVEAGNAAYLRWLDESVDPGK